MVDLAPVVLYPIAAAAIFGVFSLSVEVFGVHSLTDALWTIGGIDISLALIIAVLSVVAIVVTNQVDGSDYEPWEFAVIALAFLAPILYVALPSFAELVNAHDLIQVAFTLLAAGATAFVAYTE